jgi:hypothetical protein
VDIPQLILLALALGGLAFVLFAFTGNAGRPRREQERIVQAPTEPEWLDLEQAAAYLDSDPDTVFTLVERGAIPYFVLADGNRTEPASYFFRRDELEAWTVG